MNIISYAIGLNSSGGGSGGGGDAPTAEELTLTNNCQYAFASPAWEWFLNKYGNSITTNQISRSAYMFYNSFVSVIPFTIDCNNIELRINTSERMFSGAKKLQVAPNITGSIRGLWQMFQGCENLHSIPEWNNIDFSWQHTDRGAADGIFDGCNKLRSIPTNFLKQVYNEAPQYYNSCYNTMFSDCYYLDEIVGIPVSPVAYTTDCFYNTFYNCKRVKNIIFDTDNGNAKTANWKGQTINLSMNGGVGYSGGYSLDTVGDDDGYRLTEATQITSLNYDTLKDNPDSWAVTKEYSRYNHDSAVATINSLPDTSAYLAENGGTNTIKFTGESGKLTDGGAINTLTEEEIAVAAAKGWVVAFV